MEPTSAMRWSSFILSVCQNSTNYQTLQEVLKNKNQMLEKYQPLHKVLTKNKSLKTRRTDKWSNPNWKSPYQWHHYTYLIEQVHINGTITIRLNDNTSEQINDNMSERINIQRVKPMIPLISPAMWHTYLDGGQSNIGFLLVFSPTGFLCRFSFVAHED